MAVSGVAFTMYPVSDLPRAVAFYRDGLGLLQDVREADGAAGRVDRHIPVLVLSGRAGELDRLRGFERGCDDYVVKPFSYAELRARIEALLRRTERKESRGLLRVGPLQIDTLARQAWLNGTLLELSKKEFALLRALASDPTAVMLATIARTMRNQSPR